MYNIIDTFFKNPTNSIKNSLGLDARTIAEHKRYVGKKKLRKIMLKLVKSLQLNLDINNYKIIFIIFLAIYYSADIIKENYRGVERFSGFSNIPL